MRKDNTFEIIQENNLKFLRESRSLTQSQLCLHLQQYNCYLERSTYSKYETGTRGIPINVLVSLSYFFNTSIEYIIGITENPAPVSA
ncbi:MAG: helix-turn-helix transcriptional regulator [Clostridia bacterium]|nr:helix-turn-helix transcriptional regulator [Clostridia bacterium]